MAAYHYHYHCGFSSNCRENVSLHPCNNECPSTQQGVWELFPQTVSSKAMNLTTFVVTHHSIIAIYKWISVVQFLDPATSDSSQEETETMQVFNIARFQIEKHEIKWMWDRYNWFLQLWNPQTCTKVVLYHFAPPSYSCLD